MKPFVSAVWDSPAAAAAQRDPSHMEPHSSSSACHELVLSLSIPRGKKKNSNVSIEKLLFDIQLVWLELQAAEGWLPLDSQGWLFPFPGLHISDSHWAHPQDEAFHSGAASFRCSCGLWGQTHRQQCWLCPARGAGWWFPALKNPLAIRDHPLGSSSSCELPVLPLSDFLWQWNKIVTGSPSAQDLILLLSLTNLINSEVSRSKYWRKIWTPSLVHCPGFSNLAAVPFGIIDKAVILGRSRLLVKCWLKSWLVGWLDVRFRCGLYLRISSS